MKTKNKKLLSNLIIFIAITATVISLFVPVVSWDYYVLDTNSVEDPDMHLKISYTTLLLRYYSIYDLRNTYHPSEYNNYGFLDFTFFESGNHELKSSFSDVSDYHVKNTGFYSISVIFMLAIIAPFLWLILFSYFCYKGLKSSSKNKSKYFLYAGVINLITLIVAIISFNFLFDYIDIYNVGFSSRLGFGFGFYSFVLSIVLFFGFFVFKYFFPEWSEKT